MNFLEEIELKKKNLNEIRVHGVQVWVYLRVRFYFHFLNKKNAWQEKKVGNFLKKFHYFKSIFYGFTNWFNKYETIVFSDSSQRKKINGRLYDKLMDAWADEFSGKTLFIEMPNLNHFKKNKIHSKYIVSRILLVSIINILSLTKKSSVIQSVADIENEYNIGNIHSQWINELFSGITVYKYLFMILKPKRVFVSNYYWNIDVILAAHYHGITVAEPQHGVIGHGHFAFNTNHRFDSVYFPDIMFLFGKDDEYIIQKNGNLTKTESVGHFYIDYVNNKMVPNSTWQKKLDKYDLRIIVSLQLENGLEVLNFIKEVAEKSLNNCFIIAVRQDFQKTLLSEVPDNIIFPTDLDCYQVAKLSDIHTSVYSTCVKETLALGLTNILINFGGKAASYYENLEFLNIVSSTDEYIKLLNAYKKKDVEKVKESVSGFIKPNYLVNVKECVKKYF